MSVYTDEIFGPVLVVVRADTYTEAVGLVESNPWGNGAAIFTRDGGAARRFQHEVSAGMVGVNVPIPVPRRLLLLRRLEGLAVRRHAHVRAGGVHFWTRGKVVTARWPDPATSAIDLGFPRND